MKAKGRTQTIAKVRHDHARGAGHESSSDPMPLAQLLRIQSAIGNQGTARLLGKALPRTFEPPAETPAIARNLLATPGRLLDDPTRARMEEHFGHPFQNVRIHNGTAASAAADALGAEAYTDGRQIVLADGYSPGSPKGEEVLRHELGHVVASDRAGLALDPSRITPADHASERQASAASRRLAPGSLTAAPVGIALKRREIKGAPVVVKESRADLNEARSRQRDLAKMPDEVMREVRLRLLETQRFITAAITDSEVENTAALGTGASSSWNYAVTTTIPVIVQLIRVNVLSTPYEAGLAALLGAGLPHTAIALAGVAIAGLLLNSLLDASALLASKRQTIRQLAQIPELAFRVISERITVKLPPLIKELFRAQDASLAEVESLRSASPTELVDALGIPKPDAVSTYLPVRRQLDETLTIWRLTFHERVSSSEYVRRVEESKSHAKQETLRLYPDAKVE